MPFSMLFRPALPRFENASQSRLRHEHEWRYHGRPARRKAKQLLTPVLHEDQCGDNAEHAEKNVGPALTSRIEQTHVVTSGQ